MDLVVRPAAPDELRQVADAMRVALLSPRVDDEEWEKWKLGWVEGHLAIGAWDGDQCVGHAGAFHLDTLVPGGTWLPTAGVTRVGVLPTHARRGLLTRMMRRLLDDERADGKVLASLRASEAVIYSRYGFGVAGEATSVVVLPERARPVRGAGPGTFRILRPEQFHDVIPALYARLPHRAGAVSRSAFIWSRILKDATSGPKGTFVVVHTSPDGHDDGYALYTVEWSDEPLRERLGRSELHDLFGASPAVELALWDYLVSISLLRSISAEGRPVDDLVRLAVADMRAYDVRQRWDEQWIRLLDVEAALGARTYGAGEPVIIAVSDPWYDANNGTFAVSADGVARTDAAAELHAPIDALGATYMGAVPWADLLAVGRVTGSPDAAARADALFAHRPGTYSGTFF